MPGMCSEGSIRMMLQNSSSVPVERLLQGHSQTTVLPHSELAVSCTRAPGCASAQIWCTAKTRITESVAYRRSWSLASDYSNKPENKGWLLLSHRPQNKRHSGVTRKCMSYIQELTLSLRHAGLETGQIPFPTAIITLRSQNAALRGLARITQRNTSGRLDSLWRAAASVSKHLKWNTEGSEQALPVPEDTRESPPWLKVSLSHARIPSPGPHGGTTGTAAAPRSHQAFPHTRRHQARREPELPSHERRRASPLRTGRRPRPRSAGSAGRPGPWRGSSAAAPRPDTHRLGRGGPRARRWWCAGRSRRWSRGTWRERRGSGGAVRVQGPAAAAATAGALPGHAPTPRRRAPLPHRHGPAPALRMPEPRGRRAETRHGGRERKAGLCRGGEAEGALVAVVTVTVTETVTVTVGLGGRRSLVETWKAAGRAWRNTQETE